MLIKGETSISTTKVKSETLWSREGREGSILHWQLNVVIYRSFSGGTGFKSMKGSLRAAQVLPVWEEDRTSVKVQPQLQ